MFKSLSIILFFITSVAGAAPRCLDIFVDFKALYSTVQLVHASPAMFESLSSGARQPLLELSKGSHDFASNDVLKTMMTSLEERIGYETLQSLQGEHLSIARRAHQALAHNETQDRRDMHRNWGFKLLPDNDPVFNDSNYLRELMKYSGQENTGRYAERGGTLDAWLEAEFKTFAPVYKLIRLTVSGSAANEMAYEIARHTTGRNDADVLYMDHAYAGAHGRSSQVYMSNSKRNFNAVESPLTASLDPTDPSEVARLKPLEDAALERIRELKSDRSGVHFGALFIEPIIGAQGVKFYRTEFMLRLQALCEELKLPIVADEILTGGGRTGKFFGYQHYKGFAPDFVTFGKGLQVAGLLQMGRPREVNWGKGPAFVIEPRFPWPRKPVGTTSRGSPESILKATYIMRRIREGKLMENAATVGAYMLSQLHEIYEKKHGAREEPPRGMGMLIYSENENLSRIHYKNRFMPHLALTTEDVDKILSERPK